MTIKEPLHFAPYLKSVIWGGTRLPEYKGITTDLENVGESWELSGVPGHVSVVDRGPFKGAALDSLIERFGADLVGEENFRKYGTLFPLLIKFIDANDNLSVQVHPDDALAQKRHHSPGKTEMWNIIETRPGAKIFAGLSKQIDPDEYERRVADNSIMDVVATYDSHPGDIFFLPAGRVHAIGAGNLLAEIQQTSDITYRIYDYDRRDKEGNPRELHTELAREAIDYTVYPCYKGEAKPDAFGEEIGNCRYFEVHRLTLTPGEAPARLPHTRDSFTIVMGIQGSATLAYSAGDETQTVEIQRGETLLFPATLKEISAQGDGVILAVQS